MSTVGIVTDVTFDPADPFRYPLKFGPLSVEMQRAVVADQAVINDADTMDVDYVDNEVEAVEVDKVAERIAAVEASKQ